MSRRDSIVIETVNGIENPVTLATVHPPTSRAHGLSCDPENGSASWTVGIHGGDSNPKHAGFRIPLCMSGLFMPVLWGLTAMPFFGNRAEGRR
jgi:hypothetical protein